MKKTEFPSQAALAIGLLCTALGCAGEGPTRSVAQAAVVTTCPEPVTPDDRGSPRNASGQIRYCWPGEAGCSCDRDGDCYAEPGYTACTPPGGDPAPDPGGSDAGAGDPGPGDAGGGGGGGGDPAPVGPALPAFDSATEAHVRDLVARGAARGNARDVVAKIGDSITESASFLMDCGHGWYTLGEYADLEPTIRYFSARTLPGGENSLVRSSLCATAGWTAADALDGGDPGSPLARELDAIRPQWAIVMYGTNDLDRVDVGTYRANMTRVVDLIESRAVVPVLSTILPRADSEVARGRVPGFNEAVRSLARSRNLPLLDLWAGAQSLPSYGLSPDGIHPSTLNGSEACVFTAEGVRHGYNYRSLTALQMLARLRAY